MAICHGVVGVIEALPSCWTRQRACPYVDKRRGTAYVTKDALDRLPILLLLRSGIRPRCWAFLLPFPPSQCHHPTDNRVPCAVRLRSVPPDRLTERSAE